jgi:hypothetical protein
LYSDNFKSCSFRLFFGIFIKHNIL